MANKQNTGGGKWAKRMKSIFCIRRISRTTLPEETRALFYILPSESRILQISKASIFQLSPLLEWKLRRAHVPTEHYRQLAWPVQRAQSCSRVLRKNYLPFTTSTNDPFAVICSSDCRHSQAMGMVHHIHWLSSLRREGADCPIVPSWWIYRQRLCRCPEFPHIITSPSFPNEPVFLLSSCIRPSLLDHQYTCENHSTVGEPTELQSQTNY